MIAKHFLPNSHVSNRSERFYSCSAAWWKWTHWILQSWLYYVKINFARHQATPKEPKTERSCSRRQLFRHSWGSSVRRNKQRSSAEKYPHTCVLEPWQTQTLTELRHITLISPISPSLENALDTFTKKKSYIFCIQLVSTLTFYLGTL